MQHSWRGGPEAKNIKKKRKSIKRMGGGQQQEMEQPGWTKFGVRVRVRGGARGMQRAMPTKRLIVPGWGKKTGKILLVPLVRGESQSGGKPQVTWGPQKD